MVTARGWKVVSPEDRRKEFDERTREGVSYIDPAIPQFKPQDGDNCIRIVPPLADDPLGDQWGFNIWVHFINGYYICPRTIDKKAACVVCLGASEMRREDPELAKEMTGMCRTLVWILDCNRVPEGELKIWPAPVTLINSFLKLAKNRRTGEVISIEGPETGRAIFFEKTGTRLQTRYDSIQLDDHPFPLNPQLLNDLKYFEEILLWSEQAEMERALDEFLVSEGTRGEEGSGRDQTARGEATRHYDQSKGIDSPPPADSQKRTRPGADQGEVKFNRLDRGEAQVPASQRQPQDQQQASTAAETLSCGTQDLKAVQERIKKKLAGIRDGDRPATEDDVPY